MLCQITFKSIIKLREYDLLLIPDTLSVCSVCLSCIKVGIKLYRYRICQNIGQDFFLIHQLYTKLNTLHIHTFLTVLMDRFKLILNLCSVDCREKKDISYWCFKLYVVSIIFILCY